MDSGEWAAVEAALEEGQGLGAYDSSVKAQLRSVEATAVEAHLAQAKDMAVLHREISACDSVLEKMESMLGRFQSDLGSISSEIASLQEQSVQMNVRLRNRQALRGELSQLVDDLVVSEELIRTILDAEVTQRAFLEALHELEHKMAVVRAEESREARAAADLKPVLRSLEAKAVEKLREWLLLKVSAFRKPLSNYHVPQGALLKFRFYFQFLSNHEAEVAREVREEYVNSLSKTLYSYFKTYAGRLSRLANDDVPLKEDLLGADDTNKSASYFSLTKTSKNRAVVFSMGSRGEVVSKEGLEAPVIVPHAAQDAGQKLHPEVIVRSLGFSLVDHACHEHHFLQDFFLAKGELGAELFERVLGRSVAVLAKTVEEMAGGSWDALGLWLTLQLVYRFQALMQERSVWVLESRWEALLRLLWARFELVLNGHIESVAGPAAASAAAASASAGPHFVVRRYAELISGLLATSGLAEGGPGFGLERLQPILARLETEMEKLVRAVGASRGGGRKGALVWELNNWDLVGSVLTERGVGETREGAVVAEAVRGLREAYVEELLFPHFGAMVSFVGQTEPVVGEADGALLAKYQDKVPNIVASFGAGWKGAIEEMHREILASFTNFNAGTDILQQTLTQLLQYYDRFQKVLAHSAFASCPQRNSLVNIHHIMVELKKYKSAF